MNNENNFKSNELEQVTFYELFDIKEIQQIQDHFSNATGVASIITSPDGTPITATSNFCRLCKDIIRKTDKGKINCYKSDAAIGRQNSSGPIIQQCLSGGLWDAGASMTVGGRHIANWLIGQVKNEQVEDRHMIQYAVEIGADPEEFMSALEDVPIMSLQKFENIAQMLFGFANSISLQAYNNYQLKQSVVRLNIAEAELETERNLLRTLIDNMPDRIYAKDTQGRFIICNSSLAKRMGKNEPADIIGKSDFDLLPLELASQYYANEQEIISSGKPLINHEESMGNITGTKRWNLATKVPLYDRRGKVIGIIGMGRDITERKLVEEENIKKTILLQNINAEKDKFFSILAHDLRGPLSSFLCATQIMTDEIHSMTIDEIRDVAANMKTSASNLYSLLENLLEWSRLKQGRMEFTPQNLPLKNKISECIELFGEAARKKNIDITMNVPDNCEIIADNHMIETVIRNLISNAIKFTPNGGKICIGTDSSGGNCTLIKISDSGIGMSPELVSKLFMLNERTNRPGTDGEPSSGLGLLLCKEFVEKHGGTIKIESKEGIGTTFIFSCSSL